MLKVIPKIYDLSGGVALRGWRRRAIFFAAESRRPLGRCGLWRVARPVALQVRRVGSFFRPVRTLTKSNRADGPSLGRSQNLAFDRLAPTGRSRSECGRRVGSFFFPTLESDREAGKGNRTIPRSPPDVRQLARRLCVSVSKHSCARPALAANSAGARLLRHAAAVAERRRSLCIGIAMHYASAQGNVRMPVFCW